MLGDVRRALTCNSMQQQTYRYASCVKDPPSPHIRNTKALKKRVAMSQSTMLRPDRQTKISRHQTRRLCLAKGKKRKEGRLCLAKAASPLIMMLNNLSTMKPATWIHMNLITKESSETSKQRKKHYISNLTENMQTCTNHSMDFRGSVTTSRLNEAERVTMSKKEEEEGVDEKRSNGQQEEISRGQKKVCEQLSNRGALEAESGGGCGRSGVRRQRDRGETRRIGLGRGRGRGRGIRLRRSCYRECRGRCR